MDAMGAMEESDAPRRRGDKEANKDARAKIISTFTTIYDVRVPAREKFAHNLAMLAIPASALIFWPGLASPFLIPKTFLLLVITAMLLVTSRPMSLRDTPALATAIAAWLLVVGASAWRSDYREATPEAILLALAGPLLMLTTRDLIAGDAQGWRTWLVRTGVIISCVVFLQAFAHVNVLHIFGSRELMSPRLLVAGTLGNALFAGTFLAPCLVAALGAWLEQRDRWMALGCLAIAIAIAATGSRTGMVASAMGTLVLFAWRESRSTGGTPVVQDPRAGIRGKATRDAGRDARIHTGRGGAATGGTLVVQGLSAGIRGSTTRDAGRDARVHTGGGDVATGGTPVVQRENRTLRRKFISFIAVITIILVVACIGSLANPRSATTAARGRLFVWKVATSNGVSVLGTGPGTFAFTYPAKLSQHFAKGAHVDEYRFAGYERHAHNDWVEMLSETGGAGLFSFAAIIVIWLWTAWRRGTDATATAIVATVLAASLTDFPFHRAETWALLWIAMGAALPAASRQPSAVSEEHVWPLLAARTVAAVLILAIVWRPFVASGLLFRGERAEAIGDFTSAEADYRYALQLQPTLQDAHFDLTRTLCKQSRLAECLAQSNITAKYVDEAELYLLRARALAQLNRPAEAASELERARRRFPFAKALEK